MKKFALPALAAAFALAACGNEVEETEIQDPAADTAIVAEPMPMDTTATDPAMADDAMATDTTGTATTTDPAAPMGTATATATPTP